MKRVEREEAKVVKDEGPKKSEFVVEESAGVANLRKMFEGPAAREKAL